MARNNCAFSYASLFSFLLLIVVVVVPDTARAAATVDCSAIPSGYYCTSSSSYLWCYGIPQGAAGSCSSPLVCKCGLTTENPCVWSTSTISPCYGSPGDYIGANGRTSTPIPSGGGGGTQTSTSSESQDTTPLFILNQTNHLPLVIKFDAAKWQSQLAQLVSLPQYDAASLYSPVSSSSGYQCAFHPPQRYDANPTQMWIGRPSATTTISNTPGVTVRLPDKYFGMFLAYAMDHYGLNPSMLMSLSAKESFATVIFKEQDNSYFIVNDDNAHYDCYSSAKDGLCTDNNNDGPFQVETGGMSSDVSAFAYRFYTGSLDVAKTSRVPRYVTDNEYMTMPGFRQYHDSYTLDMAKAVVLTSVDFHFRHNMLLDMKKIGMYDALAKRVTRVDRDSLEFAAAMYAYNRGIFDTQITSMLSSCGPTADPVSCGLDGYGGHTSNIREACKLLDFAPASEVYDYPIASADLQFFLDELEATYPYDAVAPFFGHIDWSQIRADAAAAYDVLQTHRASAKATASPSSGLAIPAGQISFRYDWRALVAVVRMRLPPREFLSGPSVKNYLSFWGDQVSPLMDTYMAPSSFPVSFCSLAGGEANLCGTEVPDLCPNDPFKTAPGQCGCGVSDVDSDGDGVADCVDGCPADPSKTKPGLCGCGKQEQTPCTASDPAATLQCVKGANSCHTAMATCVSSLTSLTAAGVCDCYTSLAACLTSSCGASAGFDAGARQALLACSSC